MRTPGGPLFELAVSKAESWAIGEPAETLGQRFMLPPWLEDRREEMMSRLETIDTGARRGVGAWRAAAARYDTARRVAHTRNPAPPAK